MFTGYKKEENGIVGYNLHPGGVESDGFNVVDNAASSASDTGVADSVANTTNFDNNRQFEYDMDGESLW